MVFLLTSLSLALLSTQRSKSLLQQKRILKHLEEQYKVEQEKQTLDEKAAGVEGQTDQVKEAVEETQQKVEDTLDAAGQTAAEEACP